jgi:hypothetical protein
MILIKLFTVVVVAAIAFCLVGCSSSPAPAPTNTNASTPNATPRPSPRTPLESTLNDTASGRFAKVLVFTRLDGAPLDSDDATFLKANSPQQTNQWLKTSDGLHAVAGTNFPFKPEQLEAIQKRFKVEDMSADYGRK